MIMINKQKQLYMFNRTFKPGFIDLKSLATIAIISLSTQLYTHATEVRDNEVNFTNVTGFSFSETDLVASQDQPTGQVTVSVSGTTSRATLTVEAGRHGTTDVSDSLQGHIYYNPSASIYPVVSSTAGFYDVDSSQDMNFYTCGSLNMSQFNAKGPIDVCIFQASTGTANVWGMAPKNSASSEQIAIILSCFSGSSFEFNSMGEKSYFGILNCSCLIDGLDCDVGNQPTGSNVNIKSGSFSGQDPTTQEEALDNFSSNIKSAGELNEMIIDDDESDAED